MEKIHVTRLAFVHYQHPDLAKGLKFLKDFGLVEAQSTANRVFLRGFGIDPYVYIAEQSSDSNRHFLGAYWTVSSQEELKKAATHSGASAIMDLDGPGGGQAVTLCDPNGFIVGFVFGQKSQESSGTGHLEKSRTEPNSAVQKPRKGDFRRFRTAPSPVHKLGHYGFVVPAPSFRETLDWYQGLMNLKPTDTVYNPVTSEDQTTFNHIDLGDEYTDHHSFFVASGAADQPAHIHHSSFEVNDFDTQKLGHDWLRARDWVNCWGIGRHVLGSQIFDYWFDASGNIVEHYSDGDLVNQHTPHGREAAAPKTLYVWGPNLTLGFVTGRMEDAGKALVAPPDAEAAKPATFQDVEATAGIPEHPKVGSLSEGTVV